MSTVNLQNKLLMLAIGPVIGVVIILFGERFLVGPPDEVVEAARSARTWLAVFSVVYVINFILAWLYRDSWTATLIRLLIAGVFGFIAISATVTLVAEAWDFLGQLIGGSGPMDDRLIQSMRYALVVWTVNLVLASVCIGVGFESEEEPGAPEE